MPRIKKHSKDATVRIITLRLYETDINIMNKIISYHADKNDLVYSLTMSDMIRESLLYYYNNVVLKKDANAE